MHRKTVVSAALVLCLAGLLLFSLAPMARAGNLTVAVVDVDGNKMVSTETILKAISRTQVGDEVDAAKIDADIQSIYGLGYFTRVDWRMERVIGGIKVIFVVTENPPLKGIEVTGLTRVDPEEFKDLWGLQIGEVINLVTLDKGWKKVQKYCSDKGYLVVIRKNEFTPDGYIRFHMVELKFGGLKIEGLEKTKEHVVRREITQKEGEIFDAKQFGEDIQKLARMGLFDDIQIPTDRIEEGPGPDEIILTIVVKESKSRMVGLNFGYTGGVGFSGGLEFSDKNIFGLAQSFSTSLTLQRDASSFELAYNVPWLGPYPVSLGLEAYSRFESEGTSTDEHGNESYLDLPFDDRRTNGGAVTLGFPTLFDIDASVKLKVEQIHDLETVKDDPADPNSATHSELRDTTNNRTLTFQAIRNKMLIESGYVIGGNLTMASLERAGGWLGGDTDFYKLRGETRQFFSFAPKHVIGARLAAGTIWSPTNTDIPGTEMFSLGGSESLRGYGYREFVGTHFALLNTEYRYRFNQTFEGVLFMDLGDTWEDDAFSLNIGYGFGLRINVPILGQLRFDYGFKPGSSGRFYFSFSEMF